MNRSAASDAPVSSAMTPHHNMDNNDSRHDDEEVHVPGQLGAAQLAGEALRNDPDWTPGCWLASYWRMNNFLIAKAKQVQAESATPSQNQSQAGPRSPTIGDSIGMLRQEVFSLCPMRFLAWGIVISLLLTVLNFVVPYVQGKLIDAAMDALHEHEAGYHVDVWHTVMPYLAVIGGLMFGSYICEICSGVLLQVCGQITVTRLRIKLFRNLVMQDVSFYDSNVSGELCSRLINDSASLSSLVQFTTTTLLGACVKFFGSLAAMYFTHPVLAIIATIITPLSTWLTKKTGGVVGYYGVVQNLAMAKANAVAIEVLGNIRTVQSNVGERHEASLFMEHINYYLRIIKFTVYFETVLRFTAYGLDKLRNVTVLAVAMYHIIDGSLTIGQYTAFAQYVALYEDGFKSLADVWINFKQTLTSTGKFVQLLLRVPDIKLDGGMRPSICSGTLIFENVSFEYPARPQHLVLTDVSLTAAPGTIIALVGESGAGKTTIGRLLLRYYDPSGGRILIDGQDYKELNLRWLRSCFGFVEQEPVLFDRPIHENVAYGASQGKSLQAVEEAAKLANAHTFITALPLGYDTKPGEKAARISGGQKQRIAIARAVIREPKVLLLDEATSALDSENESIVQEALDNLMAGKTTFVIAHRLSTVVRATKILVLDKGVVIEQGSHAELTADENSRYSSFMKHQMVKPLLE